jgi:hypothetical protein
LTAPPASADTHQRPPFRAGDTTRLEVGVHVEQRRVRDCDGCRHVFEREINDIPPSKAVTRHTEGIYALSAEGGDDRIQMRPRVRGSMRLEPRIEVE